MTNRLPDPVTHATLSELEPLTPPPAATLIGIPTDHLHSGQSLRLVSDDMLRGDMVTLAATENRPAGRPRHGPRGQPPSRSRAKHLVYSNVDEDAAVVRFARVSLRLTTLVPQAHHKNRECGPFAVVRGFDRKFRNEGRGFKSRQLCNFTLYSVGKPRSSSRLEPGVSASPA